MSHTCGRDSSRREKQLSETTDHTCCKCLNHHKTDGQHRMKRLKTIRERKQTRGGGKETAKLKFHHHHHCCRQASKDTAHFYNCCHSGCNSKRDPLFPKVVSQEPSIITDHRLIGHHGLFNHEVKSIDIERFLSEQRKRDTAEEKAQDENHSLSRPSPTSCSNDLVGDDAAEDLPFEEKEPSTDIRANCQEKQEKICHQSDLTPGQRPHQQCHLSPESYKSIFSSKHSFLNVVVSTRKKKVDSVTREEDKESQWTPTLNNVETHVTLKNKDLAAQQTHIFDVSPNSPPLSSSDTPHREDPTCVSFITAMASRLCDSLQLPCVRRRDLLAESREVLLMVLTARYGPRLQENLLRDLSFGADLTQAVQDHSLEPTMNDGDDVFSLACHVDNVHQPCFDTQKTTKSNLKPQQSLKWTADWSTSPMDTSISFLDDILRPRSSPQFCMDFEPSGASAREHLLTPSPPSRWAEKVSASQHWDKSLFKPRCKGQPGFVCFENSFMSHSRTVRERRCKTWLKDNDAQPSFSYQTQPVHFPLEPDPFRTDRRSLSSFSTQIPNPNPSSHSQTHRRSRHTSTLLGTYHSDIIHYPPSHMLDRGPAPSPFSLPSPEHWAFPPMKLY